MVEGLFKCLLYNASTAIIGTQHSLGALVSKNWIDNEWVVWVAFIVIHPVQSWHILYSTVTSELNQEEHHLFSPEMWLMKLWKRSPERSIVSYLGEKYSFFRFIIFTAKNYDFTTPRKLKRPRFKWEYH